MIRCLHCGAETSNGLALCELCRRYAKSMFDMLPIYVRNLTRWRPGRAGARPVPGSRVLYDGTVRGVGTGDRISDRLDEAMTAMTTWARALNADRGPFAKPLTWADAVLSEDIPQEMADDLADDPARVAAALCVAFAEHLTSVSTLDWCGEFVRDLGHHEDVLRGLTETLVPGWYAGACRQVIGDTQCSASTYVVPGLTWVTCGRCGVHTAARDHLDLILDEASGWVATPKRIAEALVALVDTEQSVTRLHDRIRQWEQREKLTAIRRTERDYAWSEAEERVVVVEQEAGLKRYRLGEVLALVTSRTRRVTVDARAS